MLQGWEDPVRRVPVSAFDAPKTAFGKTLDKLFILVKAHFTVGTFFGMKITNLLEAKI